MSHIASVSWGKDSLAMLIYIMENKFPLDEVVFYDTEAVLAEAEGTAK